MIPPVSYDFIAGYLWVYDLYIVVIMINLLYMYKEISEIGPVLT